MKIKHKNIPFFFLLACFCLLSFSLYYPVFYFKGYDGKRELQIVILLLIQCLLFLPSIFQQYINIIINSSVKIKIALSVFILSGFIATLFVAHPLYAWGDFFQTLLFVNATFIMISAFVLYPQIKSIILAAIICGFCIALVEFVFRSVIGLHLEGKIIPTLAYPSFGNYRFFNQVQVQLVLLVTSLTIVLPLKYRKWMALFGAVSVFMLLVAGARGAILSIGCVFIFSYFFSNQYLRRLSNNFLKAIVIGVIFYIIYIIYESIILGSSSSEYLLRIASSGRLAMWLETIPSILKNPFGVGPYHYSGFSLLPEFGLYYRPSHPHNSVLQIFLEWGWLAGFSMLFWLANFLLYIKKLFTLENDILRLAIGCSLLAACLYSLFSGVFVMPASQITFVFLLALLLSNDYKKINYNLVAKNERDTNKSSFVGFKIKMICLMLVLSVSMVYVFYVIESFHRYSLMGETPNSSILTVGPRMWTSGGIVVYSNNK